jgi:ABC-type transport system involved in multi-copper enzyme maturation permease subunit
MRSIWQSLAWKEWHEHKWKLVAILAVPWGATSLLMIADSDELGHVWAVAQISMYLCIFPFAVFIGVGAAAGERSRRTLPFLQALPLPMWRVALYKVAFGLISLVVPVLISMLLILVGVKCLELMRINSAFSIRMLTQDYTPLIARQNIFVDMAIVESLAAAGLFFWSATSGVNRKDEISAGAWALIAMVAWWVLLISFWGFLLLGNTGVETARMRALGVGTAPGGIFMLGKIAAAKVAYTRGVGVVAAMVACGLLAARYVVRFGCVAESEIRSPHAAILDAKQSKWFAPPRRCGLTAIIWKQVREGGPILLTGLAGTVGIFLVYITLSWNEISEINGKREAIFSVFSVISLAFGFIVALVLGIGVCLYDVSPPLNAFWQSRPIDRDLWFWSKFLSGLSILLMAIYLPIVALACALRPDLSVLENHSDASIFVFPFVHIAIFAAAVMMTCLVRQAVYAAILSVAAVYLGMLVGDVMWHGAGYAGWVPSNEHIWWEPTVTQTAFGLITSFCISTLVAWLAMRYDWGRKSRY